MPHRAAAIAIGLSVLFVLTACSSIPTKGLNNVASDLRTSSLGKTEWSTVFSTGGEGASPALQIYIAGKSAFGTINERLVADGFHLDQGGRWFRNTKAFGIQNVQVLEVRPRESITRYRSGSSGTSYKFTVPGAGVVLVILSSPQ